MLCRCLRFGIPHIDSLMALQVVGVIVPLFLNDRRWTFICVASEDCNWR